MHKNIDIYLYGYSGNSRSLQEFAGLYSKTNDFVVIDLPGFADGQILDPESHHNILAYTNHVISRIEETAMGYSAVRLIGHSHGAMLAFAVASLRPKLADEVILLCPVASPRHEVKLFIVSIKLLSHIVGVRTTLWLAQRRSMVDLVTRRVSNPTWSRDDYRRIKKIRREEVSFYNRTLIDCADQVRYFKGLFADTYLDTQAVVLYATDDSVASKDDYMWFKQHIPHARMVGTVGGHHIVVAHPKKTVGLLQSEASI